MKLSDMRLPLVSVLNADVQKIHAEINQFRSHEFLVLSGAVAAFAATAQELPKSQLLGAGLLLLLLGLFFWHYVLTDTRSRLTSYLRVTSNSVWEHHYRAFANESGLPGQRQAAVIIFVVLGILTVATTFSKAVEAWFMGREIVVIPRLFAGYFIVSALYLSLVTCFGRINYGPVIKRYEDRWEKAIGESTYAKQSKLCSARNRFRAVKNGSPKVMALRQCKTWIGRGAESTATRGRSAGGAAE